MDSRNTMGKKAWRDKIPGRAPVSILVRWLKLMFVAYNDEAGSSSSMRHYRAALFRWRPGSEVRRRRRVM